MARRDDVLGVTGADTVIGAGVTVHGDLGSEGDMVIDGTMRGTLKVVGNLTIGVNAHIKASVEALNITIAGTLEGNIICGGEVSIRETGQVTGDITAAGLAITSGGVFSGRSIIHKQHALDLTPAEREEA